MKPNNKSLLLMAIAVAMVFSVAIWGVDTGSAAKQPDVQMVPASFSLLADNARPSVVNIRTVKSIRGGGRVFRHFFGPQSPRNPFEDFFGPFMGPDTQPDFKQRSLGSGFIYDKKGHIVTNNHVIDGADEIRVKLSNEKEYDAKVVGRDPNTDLALIKIEASEDLVPLPIGNSEKLKVGQWVVAIGSPFGLEQTVTAGIVSAKGRIIGSGPYDDFIQTDASINPGNSGGPLIDLQGRVVGINTAIIASGQGIGFAIPIDMAEGIISQLKESGEVSRGWLGVGIQNMTPEMRDYYELGDVQGVLVMKVYEDDPADKAGIKPKDIITEVDGQPVSNSRELSRRIADIGEGKTATLTVIRGGKELTLTAALERRPDEESLASRGETESEKGLGLQVETLRPDVARQLGFGADEKGALVTSVDPDSAAAEAGIRRGDLIKEINRKTVDDADAFLKAIEGVDSGQDVRLLIRRKGGAFVIVKLTK